MKRPAIGVGAALLTIGCSISSAALAAPVISNVDLWQLAPSVSYSVPGGGSPVSPVRNMFGYTGGIENPNAILANGKGPGTVHTVDWQTSMDVTVRSFSLFLGHDRGNPGFGYKIRDARARGIQRFELFADTSGTGTQYASLFVADVVFVDGGATTGIQPTGTPDCRPPGGCLGGLTDPIYGGATLSGPGDSFTGAQGALSIIGDFAPTTAHLWRAQFTQVGNYLDAYSDTGGPRILELDGLANHQVVPLPAPAVLLASGIAVLAGRRRLSSTRRNPVMQ